MQTKTKVKPAINNKVAINAFDFLIDLLSFNPNPVIKERYQEPEEVRKETRRKLNQH